MLELQNTIIFMSDGQAEYPEEELETLKTQHGRIILQFWTVTLGEKDMTVLEKINTKMNGEYRNITNSEDIIQTYAKIAIS
ncbi:unnamed protein product [Didymodactylos carnosus]|nr:unnamed protein product [Didymodactylos carnosus]CAF4409781.1 unnamed protein product [Didymodactylos carnosus]